MGCCTSSDGQAKIELPTRDIILNEPVATASTTTTLLPAPPASPPSTAVPQNDMPKYYNVDLIKKIVDVLQEPQQSKDEFTKLADALENAVQAKINLNNNNNNKKEENTNSNDDHNAESASKNNKKNKTTKSSPLFEPLARFIHEVQPQNADLRGEKLSVVAVALIVIYATETSKPTSGVTVQYFTYVVQLASVFKYLQVTFDLDVDALTDQLATSLDAILCPIFPSTASILATPVAAIAGPAEITVMEEYQKTIRASCRTLKEWRSYLGRSTLSPITVWAVDNYFKVEIDLTDRLERANAKLSERNDEHDSQVDKLAKNEQFIEKIGQERLPFSPLSPLYLSERSTIEHCLDVHRFTFIMGTEKEHSNAKLNFIEFLFPTQLSQLRQLYIRRVQALITNDTIKSIRPGATPRHSRNPPYGLRSRHKEFESLCAVLKEFRNNTKESCPLIDVSTMPRQGKTTLLDAIGYSPEVLRAFAEDSSNVFVLYLNFNAMWPCKIETDDASTALDAAKRHISLRLLAGARGIHHGDMFDEPIEHLLTVLNDPKLVLENVILPRLSKLTSIPREKIKIIIAADEFSNLEPKSYNAFMIEKCRLALYSMMANLSSSRVAVVVSGFTPIPDIQSTTGRAVKQIALCPFNTTVSRQESLPMRSEFFRLVSTMDINKTQSIFNEPVAVFELVKASPGIFGALVEMKHHMKTSVGEAVNVVPFLLRLAIDSWQYRIDMSAMLEWKSVQAAAKNLDNAAFGKLTNESDVQLVAHFPREAVLSPSCVDHLALIRIDPMFLARATDRNSWSEFSTFLRQLNNYGYQVTHGLTNRNFDNSRNLIRNRFERDSGESEQSMRHNSNIITLADWTSYFFHEAVATGILYQTDLRRDFMFGNDVEKITFTLGDFLKGATKIGSLQKETNTTKGESAFLADELELMWSVQFKKNAAQKDIENATAEGNTASQQLPRGISCGPSSIAYFNGCPKILNLSLDTLHQPACREENNLADILFHLATAADGNRWVEVWIDINHSSSAPLKKQNDPGIFPSSDKLERSLANDVLQSEDSHVDHVVHIVVTVFTPSEMTQQLPKVDLGRLKSYSLFYVHPDSTAFENLVSQPIKEAMPTLDQHDERNWTLDLPPEINDWKYYRATKRDIVEHFSSVDEFTRWRNICFDEDCSIALDNLNPALSEILPREIRSVPLGCVIEALGIRPFSVSTLQQQYYAQYRVEISNEKVQFFGGATNFSLSRSDPISQKILAQVTIGHFMHHETDFWNELFAHDKEKKANEKCLSQDVWNAPVSDADRIALSVKNAHGNAAKILLDSALANLRSGLIRR